MARKARIYMLEIESASCERARLQNSDLL